jgi:hypothetical protein
VRDAILNRLAPIGYEDETGFHYGTQARPCNSPGALAAPSGGFPPGKPPLPEARADSFIPQIY